MASTRPSDSAIPIIFLKTPTTPSDLYTDLFTRTHPPSHSSYIPLHVPILQHTHILQSIFEIFDPSLSENAGLIYTSQRAVSAFEEACSKTTSEVRARILGVLNLPLYVVGPATAASLRVTQEKWLPQCRVVGENTGTGKALADLILDDHRTQMSVEKTDGKDSVTRMVFLTGERHRDVIPQKLRAAGVGLQEVVVYKTGLRPALVQDLVKALDDTREGDARYHWVVLFSASAANEILQCMGALDDSTGEVKSDWFEDAKRRARVAAIGPTTAEAMRCEYGFMVDAVAEEPSPEGIRNAIEKAVINLSL